MFFEDPSYIQFKKKYLNKDILRKILNVFFILVCSLIAKYLFNIYEIYNNNKAIIPLYNLIQRYEGGIKTKSDFPIKELIEDCDKDFKNNKKASLSPYFILVKAASNSFLEENDYSNTIENLNLLIKKTKNSKDLNFIYKSALALFLIKNEKTYNEGIEIIKLLLNSKSENYLKEMLIFYHGLYLLKNKNLKSADEVWNIMLNHPIYKNSIYADMIKKARNWDY